LGKRGRDLQVKTINKRSEGADQCTVTPEVSGKHRETGCRGERYAGESGEIERTRPSLEQEMSLGKDLQI